MEVSKGFMRFLAVLCFLLLIASSFSSGVKYAEEAQQKTIESETYKRCLDGDQYQRMIVISEEQYTMMINQINKRN